MMYYVVETEKTLRQAATDLEKAVSEVGFGLLHVHNLGEMLRGKGVDFTEDCQVF